MLPFFALDHDKSPPSFLFFCTTPPKLNENQGLWRPNLCELWCFAAAAAAGAAAAPATAATAAATAAFCFAVLQLLLCCCSRCCCHCCRRRRCCCCSFAAAGAGATFSLCCCCCWLLAPAQNLPTSTFRPPPSPQVFQETELTPKRIRTPAAFDLHCALFQLDEAEKIMAMLRSLVRQGFCAGTADQAK